MSRPTTHTPELAPGERRLLHHLAVLRIADRGRVSARRRLERKLGPDLAASLLASLAVPERRAA